MRKNIISATLGQGPIVSIILADTNPFMPEYTNSMDDDQEEPVNPMREEEDEMDILPEGEETNIPETNQEQIIDPDTDDIPMEEPQPDMDEIQSDDDQINMNQDRIDRNDPQQNTPI